MLSLIFNVFKRKRCVTDNIRSMSIKETSVFLGVYLEVLS